MTDANPAIQIHPQYRSDIDGLRALAVLSVVGFHAFPEWVYGGFIGVDVFFVISGYLISTIIFKNLENDSFRIGEFYSRRIRRIFPALILVLLFCYLFGWFSLLAEEYRQLGKHIAGGGTFASNILYWFESGYFDNASDTKPLLHLWSLGIEEQFYIIWPLVLWLAWKYKFSIPVVLILAVGLSFLLNVSSIDQNIVATFYSPQTRFWELLSGSILAWCTLYWSSFFKETAYKFNSLIGTCFSKQPPNSYIPFAENIASVIGLLLLIAGILIINKEAKFPGWWALLPVIGGTLLIMAGPSAYVNRIFLSNKVAIFIGLISFPLYLWHWPLLSFARIIEGETPNLIIRIFTVSISFLLAWLTYKFIERPLRFAPPNTLKVAILLISLLIMGFLGYNAYKREGLPHRTHAYLRGFKGDLGHLQYHKYVTEHFFICTPQNIAAAALQWDGFIRCMQSKPSTNIDIALIGDSHAEHLFTGLAEVLPNKNIVFYIKGSQPFIDNSDFKNIFTSVIKNENIKDVVITMHWFGRYEPPNGSTLEDELIKTVDALSRAHKQIIIIDDVPTFPFGPEKCGYRWIARKKQSCEISMVDMQNQQETYMRTLNAIQKRRPNIKIVNISKYFCNATSCSMIIGDEIAYRDAHHLNLNGSRYVAKKIIEDNPNIF